MALNPFDDAVDDLAAAPAPHVAPVNPYDAIVNDHRADTNAQGPHDGAAGGEQTPERAAEAPSMPTATGSRRPWSRTTSTRISDRRHAR
jgi:hypothetical protein